MLRLKGYKYAVSCPHFDMDALLSMHLQQVYVWIASQVESRGCIHNYMSG